AFMSQTGKSRRPRAPALPLGRAASPFRVGFYLAPEFPMMAFAAAIEPLRAANRLSGQLLYAWTLYSRDHRPVRASNGIEVAVQGALGDPAPVDLLLVCAGTHDPEAAKVAGKWLRSLSRAGVAVGGISLGAYV